MHRYVTIAATAASLTIAIALPVAAQYAKPEDAVKYRKAAFTVMNSHMGRINSQLKSPSPDMQTIQNSAGVVEAMSKLPWDAFGHDTEFVAESRALPSVYKNEARIKELAGRMQEEAARLSAVAKTGDAKAARTQFFAVAKSCDNCHDDFRAK